MAKVIVASLIVGAAIVVAVSMYIYNSPYQTCLRAFTDENGEIVRLFVLECGKQAY